VKSADGGGLELLAASRSETAAVLSALESSPDGLSEEAARRKIAAFGPNVVVRDRKTSIWRELLGRGANPLNVLLLTLAGVSYMTDDVRAAVVIAAMVVLSVGLGFIQEHRSNKAAAKLQAMVKTTASARRRPVGNIDGQSDGALVELPIEQLAPGDVVILSAGDMIPADLRLLSARDLHVNQATLTGEALPVEKSAAPFAGDAQAQFELPNICFMGSSVESGVAEAVVIATGPHTAFGLLAEDLQRPRALTSFDKGVNQFTWLMIGFMAVMAPAVFLINGLTKGNWLEALLFAVAVAVGLTPEMLPMIVTVNLSKGAIQMSRRRVIVKRLNAIQNFGAMNVLCTDKTGTLTQDRIILKRHLDFFGNESARVLEYAYLNSRFQSGLKNLLDVAILKHAELEEHLRPEHRYRKVDELPFDFERRRLSVALEREDGRHLLICKGAVEEIFAVCTRYEADGESRLLDESHFQEAQREKTALNSDGFRVVAVAYKEIEARETYTHADECDLTLVGYVAFLDPPKDSAGAAIAALHEAGVQVKILTGDNDVVTRKICSEVGLPVGRILLGAEIAAMTEVELEAACGEIAVFAKVSPHQKERIIKALQAQGNVVGFLGDGINDSLALKAADVGVSVDTAVDVAKESADIILLEKSLMVLREGVMEGRAVFGNITKYIKMGASSSFGNMFSVLGASVFLPFLPMAPIQVLTNNLLYDFSQAAIPTDTVDEEYLQTPRRWDIANIWRFMVALGPVSSIFDYATYFTMLYVFGAWNNAPLFQTGWFIESLLTQTLIIHIIRTARTPFIESRASHALMATTAIVCMTGAALPYTALGAALGFVEPPRLYWLALTLIVAGYVILAHLVKTWFVRRWGM
jgi:P-type Mg2+ transporter